MAVSYIWFLSSFIRLELTHSKRYCNASLHMNDTLAMSGGQITAPSPYPSSKDSWLHLGAISEVFGIHHHAPQDMEPFTGCMLGLRVSLSFFCDVILFRKLYNISMNRLMAFRDIYSMMQVMDSK